MHNSIFSSFFSFGHYISSFGVTHGSIWDSLGYPEDGARFHNAACILHFFLVLGLDDVFFVSFLLFLRSFFLGIAWACTNFGVGRGRSGN